MQLPLLHPILVNFTAALVPVSVFSDLVGRVMRRSSLMAVGWWTMLYAAIVTPFTALAGWLWFRSMPPMDMPEMTLHKFLGTELAVVLALLAWWRWRAYRRDLACSPMYLAVAVLVVLSLIVQGHVGGTMSFGAGNDSVDSMPATHGARAANAAPDTPQWRDHIDMRD